MACVSSVIDGIPVLGKNLGTLCSGFNCWFFNWIGLSPGRISGTFRFNNLTKYRSVLAGCGCSSWDFRNAIAGLRKQPTLTFTYYPRPHVVVNEAPFNSS